MIAPKQQRVLGVIGGMGPEATVRFFGRVVAHTSVSRESDHLRVILDSDPKRPSRTRAFLFGEEDPTDSLVRSAQLLTAAGADFLAMPCNSAHYFLPAVRQRVETPFVDMIEETCLHLHASGVSVAGVIAGEVTAEGRLYEQACSRLGLAISFVHTDAEEQKVVRSIIEAVKVGRALDAAAMELITILDALIRRGCSTVVLACTELPILRVPPPPGCSLVDTLDVLARAAIRQSGA